MAKKVVIVGAGPAGLFAAYKLSKKADITLIDKKRIGGAGLFSDGKLIYHTRTGTNLPEIIGKEKTQGLIDEVEKIFTEYGVETDKRDTEKERDLMKKAAQNGIEFISSKQAHVGSDNLPKTIEKLVSDIDSEIILKEEIVDFEKNILRGERGEYKFDHLIIATGRSGSRWFEQLVENHNIEKGYNPVDIGVRVEVPASIMEEQCKISWDFKARMITPTYEDPIRTFCVCPNGFVVKEKYEGFCLVNGHSMKTKKSENTNFAFLVHWKPKDPVKSGNVYGEAIARKAATIWGEKPAIQRLGDLRRGRRSTWDRIEKYKEPEPTLKNITPGDIGSGLEYRFVLDILEGFGKLEKIIPGVSQDSTLLYAPEIKFHGIKVKTDKYLQTNIPEIYVAGDGAGVSRGIVGAAASGLLVAEGILKKL